ncbi:MAG: UDP-N-acetylmuramoyl-tripeptide--D-alanyl-D-alanine ligase [Candidatus Omnitrophica bacterium]|nr:UDP-N-acetylmuramoyl-tripeptide--D-alanyl-D-alanine ligase [Candidatus Omnitrophota bacterium]
MPLLKVSEIISATDGTLTSGRATAAIRQVITDSRLIKKGDLFVAIVGKKYDAHDFIADVIKKGAAAVVVSKNFKPHFPEVAVIKVADTTKALGDIARYHRLRFSIPIVAITGSAGKTTTKEMISGVLSRKYKVLKNIGTENNQFGVPLTILKLKPSHQIAVLEVGTNQPGDIQWLASIVRPTVAIITNIGESHLELLKTPKDVFKEKFNLVKALSKNGTVIINNDDPFLQAVPGLVKQKVLTVGIRNKSQLQAFDIAFQSDRIQFYLQRAGVFTILGTATANVTNALTAICCGRLFKIGYNDIKNSLKSFSLKSGRQTCVKVGNISVIDDTYNANPVSFRSALESLSHVATSGRRVLICADMLELGREAPRLHREIGERAADSGLNYIFSFGKFSELIGAQARKRNPELKTFHSVKAEQIEKQIKKYLRSGDIVLIKGSRGMRAERFVSFIKKNFN